MGVGTWEDEIESRIANLEATVNKSNFSAGLCWLAGDEVVENGWYWMRNNGETGIVNIREYGRKMCVGNWAIAEEAKYYGPLPEPT